MVCIPVQYIWLVLGNASHVCIWRRFSLFLWWHVNACAYSSVIKSVLALLRFPSLSISLKRVVSPQPDGAC